MNKIEANSEFAEWAKNPRAGMFGNPDGEYAFCGIEPGRQGDLKIDEKELSKKNKVLIPNITDEERKLGHFGPEDVSYKKWPVGYWISLVMMLLDENSRKFRPEALKQTAKTYQKERLFSKNGEVFQINLYPLPFPRLKSREKTENDWRESTARQLTGIETKSEYQKWCKKNRFDRLRKFILEKSKAKMLVCFGQGQWEVFADMLEVDCPDKTAEFVVTSLAGKRILFIPFLGNRQISHRCLRECFL